jgi:hypothetical protein
VKRYTKRLCDVRVADVEGKDRRLIVEDTIGSWFNNGSGELAIAEMVLLLRRHEKLCPATDERFW